MLPPPHFPPNPSVLPLNSVTGSVPPQNRIHGENFSKEILWILWTYPKIFANLVYNEAIFKGKCVHSPILAYFLSKILWTHPKTANLVYNESIFKGKCGHSPSPHFDLFSIKNADPPYPSEIPRDALPPKKIFEFHLHSPQNRWICSTSPSGCFQHLPLSWSWYTCWIDQISFHTFLIRLEIAELVAASYS